MKPTLTLIVFFLMVQIGFYSCNQKKKEVFTINQTSEPVPVLKKRALNEGDTLAYYELSIDYMDSPYDGFLYTALTFANKYEYKLAYMDVFYCLTDYYHKNDEDLLKGLDGKTRQMAIEYLKLAAEAGDNNAKDLIELLELDTDNY